MHELFHYLRVKKADAGVETEGTLRCQLGCSVPGHRDDDFHGVIAEWEWDGKQLTARNDYSGYYPVFYYADEDQVMISDSLLKLIALGAPTGYDEDALSVFCRCGFFLNESTPFRDIRVLPPNADFTWRDGVLSLSGGKRLVGEQSMSAGQVVDGYIDLFRAAMKRYSPRTERFALPLSGGRDSRQILLELRRQGKMPRVCVTCGEQRDIVLAREMTQRLDLSHRVLDARGYWAGNAWRKNVGTNLCTQEHAWLVVLADYLAANSSEVYEGTGVGVLTRSDFLKPENVALYERGCLEDIGLWLFGHYGPSEQFFGLLNGEFSFLRAGRDVAIQTFAHTLDSLSKAANPLTSMSFWNWGRRGIGLHPFGLQQRTGGVNTPFLDRALYDFLSSLSPDAIAREEPQGAAIRKAFPEFAAISFNDEIARSTEPRVSVWHRCAGIVEAISLFAGRAISHLPSLFRVYASGCRGKGHTNALMVLLYLSQLSYCRDASNAENVLSQYKRSCRRMNGEWRDRSMDVAMEP